MICKLTGRAVIYVDIDGTPEQIEGVLERVSTGEEDALDELFLGALEIEGGPHEGSVTRHVSRFALDGGRLRRVRKEKSSDS